MSNSPTLRPYQQTGAKFLADRRFAILGDKMGLGKTPQALTAALKLDPRVLVWVAPAATLPGLQREIRRWGGPEAHIVTGKSRIPSTGWLLMPWSVTLKNRLSDLPEQIDICILDEAHFAKNPKAGRTAAALGRWEKVDGYWRHTDSLCARARRVWALTGTPVPNRPVEMRGLLQMGGGIKWASMQSFGRYCRQPNKFAPSGYDYHGAFHLDELRQRLQDDGILLRRTPEMLGGEGLPSLVRQTVMLSCGRGDAAGKRVAKAVGMTYEEIAEALGRGECPVPFEELAGYRSEIGGKKIKCVSAWVCDWLEAQDDDAAIVLFAHHRDVVEGIAQALEAKGVSTLHAHGEHTPEARQALVDRFAAGEAQVFIGTTGACGTGLNGLHLRTGYCAFAEMEWTPAEFEQAEGRIRRFGSTCEMAVAYYLAGEESLESYILQTVLVKMAVIEEILGDDDAAHVEIAAEVAAEVPQEEVVYEAPEEEIDPATLAWAFAKDRRTGAWCCSTQHRGQEAWIGCTVTIRTRAGKETSAVLRQRVAHNDAWSMWDFEEIRDHRAEAARKASYVRRRGTGRGIPDADDQRPLTEDERQQAEVALQACDRLCALDGDFAQKENGVGWRKGDHFLGLAVLAVPLDCWTYGNLRTAQELLRTYRRTQISDLWDAIHPTTVNA